jgi:hypothetical protein
MLKRSAQWNAFFLYSPIIIGLIAGLIFPNPRKAVLIIYVIGLMLFFVAKCSQFYKRKWITFGTVGMKSIYRYVYWIGYCLMGFSVFIALVMFFVQNY